MEVVQNFKFRSRFPYHAHFRGQSVVHWLAHVMVNVYTKYEVSIFGRSKDIKGVPKFRKWSRDLSHAPLGVKFSYGDKGLHNIYWPPKLECVALSVPKLWGSQILNLGHVSLTTPTLGSYLSSVGKCLLW